MFVMTLGQPCQTPGTGDVGYGKQRWHLKTELSEQPGEPCEGMGVKSTSALRNMAQFGKTGAYTNACRPDVSCVSVGRKQGVLLRAERKVQIASPAA